MLNRLVERPSSHQAYVCVNNTVVDLWVYHAVYEHTQVA